MKNLLKKNNLGWLPVLFLTLPLLLSGCSGSNEPSITDSTGARDAALNYLNEKYDDNIPAQNLLWQEEDKTNSGLLGQVIKSYTSDEWTILVSYPVVKPDLVVYTIALVNNNTGWKWEGKINANGTADETRPLKQITQEESQQAAEEFVKSDLTFKFDGIADTFKFIKTVTLRTPFAWQYTFGFQCRHAGYGDRTGQVVAQVITLHTAVIAVIRGQVATATLDGIWNMINQQMLNDTGISQAPIHEIEVYFMESFPVQVGVHMKGGLSDGCTTFNEAAVKREGNTINIDVTVQQPEGISCSAICSFFEENMILGSEFTIGSTHSLKANDYTTTILYR